MKFPELLEKAFKLIRIEQSKSDNNQNLVFFIKHGDMIDIAYDMDPQSSLAASDFVYRDRLLGFPVHPVLETKEGIDPPSLICVNLEAHNAVKAHNKKEK